MTYKDRITETSEFLHGWFLNNGKSLAVAESCTGGGVSAAIVANSGCSEYYICGVVAYSNRCKTDVLKVATGTLTKFGAVSGEVAEAMANGVRKLSGADYSVSTTGITGPGGGSLEKPIGTIWIAVSNKKRILARQLETVDEGRENNCQRAIFEVLSLLKELVLNDEKALNRAILF